MTRSIRALGLLGFAAFALACSSSTTMVTTWSAPGANKASVKRILVLGISQNYSMRRTYEDTFAGKLRDLGYQAIPGYLWVPDASKFDKEAIAGRVKAEGVTNVLVTRVVGNKTVTTETPSTVVVGVGYSPYGPGYYGGWGSYYSMGYSTMVTPGYTTVNNVVTLETNFYETTKEPESLVWSGQSQTWVDQGSGQSQIGSVIGKVVYQMRAQGII